jgi:hypothetical protein
MNQRRSLRFGRDDKLAVVGMTIGVNPDNESDSAGRQIGVSWDNRR